MTRNCELCGRGMAKKTLVPYFWPHKNVCRRARCKAAAEDALRAVLVDRDLWDDLVGNIAQRHTEQTAPVGYRQDAMAKVDQSDEDWWATEIANTIY